MKVCSKCNERFEDGFNFCLIDGDTLVEETDTRSPEYQPPPFGHFPDDLDNSLGGVPTHSPPPVGNQMPSSSGSLKSFGGLERLGPVDKLKRFFFGDS